MKSKEEQLYSHVVMNEVKQVKTLLAQKDIFDINWRNIDKVLIINE